MTSAYKVAINIKDPILSQLERVERYKNFLGSEEGKDIKECLSKIEVLIDKFPTEIELVVDYELLESPHGTVLFNEVNKIEKERNKRELYDSLKEMVTRIVNAREAEDHEWLKEKKQEFFGFFENMEKVIKLSKEMPLKERIQVCELLNSKKY